VCLEWPAAQTTLLDLTSVIDVLVHRREHLEREIVANLPGSPWETQVGRLRCLRGVDTLTAVGLCAEVGDFERFARAEQLMSYLGLVPSQVNDREQSPARVDHEDRLRARPAAARRGGLALVRREALCCIPGAAGTNSKLFHLPE
jgi:transposase